MCHLATENYRSFSCVRIGLHRRKYIEQALIIEKRVAREAADKVCI